MRWTREQIEALGEAERKRAWNMTEKTLDNKDVAEVKQKVPDVQVVGNGDMFRLLCKASSKEEGWMKSAKAMEIPEIGCVVQVTTQQRNPDGSYAVAEALTFVGSVKIEDDVNGGRKLVPIIQ
jgi:tRNA-dihydrouridine synthase